MHDHGESDTDKMQGALYPREAKDAFKIKKMFAGNHFLKNKVVNKIIRLNRQTVLCEF
jgi:hypothetical protein